MFVVCSNGKHNRLYIVHSKHRSDHSTEGGATYCCICLIGKQEDRGQIKQGDGAHEPLSSKGMVQVYLGYY